jgi:hypothetical protein
MQGGTTKEVGFQVFIPLTRFPIKHWLQYEPRDCHVKLLQCSRATPRLLSSVNSLFLQHITSYLGLYFSIVRLSINSIFFGLLPITEPSGPLSIIDCYRPEYTSFTHIKGILCRVTDFASPFQYVRK